MRRVLSMLAAALTAAATLFLPATAAHADSVCGNQADDWVPAAGSSWLIEFDFSGDQRIAEVTFTSLGHLAVTTVVDPFGVYTGQWSLYVFENRLEWDATAPGDVMLFYAQAASCGLFDNVLTADGPVVHYPYGQVGTLHATRVL